MGAFRPFIKCRPVPYLALALVYYFRSPLQARNVRHPGVHLGYKVVDFLPNPPQLPLIPLPEESLTKSSNSQLSLLPLGYFSSCWMIPLFRFFMIPLLSSLQVSQIRHLEYRHVPLLPLLRTVGDPQTSPWFSYSPSFFLGPKHIPLIIGSAVLFDIHLLITPIVPPTIFLMDQASAVRPLWKLTLFRSILNCIVATEIFLMR